jgi:hypothetical protein
MIQIVAFDPAHLDAIELRAEQLGEVPAHGGNAANHGPAFTALDDAGRVVTIAGLAEIHAAYASAWAMIASDARRAMPGVVRAMRAVIDSAHYARVDMAVRADWAQAHLLARRLGFENSGLQRKFWPDGGDAVIYARIREDS